MLGRLEEATYKVMAVYENTLRIIYDRLKNFHPLTKGQTQTRTRWDEYLINNEERHKREEPRSENNYNDDQSGTNSRYVFGRIVRHIGF